jgi:hypothetical protein
LYKKTFIIGNPHSKTKNIHHDLTYRTRKAQKVRGMPSIRTTFLWTLAAAAPVAFGHTWGEQLRNINDKGEYVGAYGYMRGYRVRGGPDFNEDALVQRMPASNENGKIFITADQLLCHENQRERKQASDRFPRLQTAPGNFVAIRYQENGHITTAGTIVGKPENGGTVYVYGTTDPKSDEKLVDVLQWTQNGKGGDSRGVLLAMNDYDDRRCYLNNETPIAQERKLADPAYMAGTPQSGPANSVMYCETNVKLPDTIEQGRPYTLYWVWQWPTLPGKNDGLPNGKDEYYSTCIDVDVASPKVALATKDASQLAKFAMLQQDAVSTAVSNWASRTALFSDFPSKREMGPVFSSLPNDGFTGRYTQTASLTMTNLNLATVSNTEAGDHTSVKNTGIRSTRISSQLPISTESSQNIVRSTGDVAQSPSNGSRSSSLKSGNSAVLLSTSRNVKPNLSESIRTVVQPLTTASAGVPILTSTSTLISVSPSSSVGFGTQNETLELSPAAVEALRLAQFLKNLGAAALNTSSWPDGSVYTSLADLLAELLEASILPTIGSDASANLNH